MDASIFNTLDNLLANSDLSTVTEESSGFTELPDGYYLCEIEDAELKESKTSNQPMVAFKFKVCEDGKTSDLDGSKIVVKDIKKTKNRKLFVYYVLKDESSVKRFASDMLKFEAEPGKALLPKEAFMSSDTVEDALDILVGSRIYVMVSTTVLEDGTKSTWNNLISWKRAAALELPM